MVNVVFIILILITLYYTFISPNLNKYRLLTTDSNFKVTLVSLEHLSEVDKISYYRAYKHLRKFIAEYLRLDCNTDKLVTEKFKTMRYFKRIKFSMRNNLELELKTNQALYNLNTILENYTFAKWQNCGKIYTGSIS